MRFEKITRKGNINIKELLFVCFALLMLIIPVSANATTETKQIDLSKWQSVSINYSGSEIAPTWKLNSTNTAVTQTQTLNSRPAVFLSDIECTNNSVNGSFIVDTTNDNDFVGFVFGYKDTGHFYLFDWRQEDEDFHGLGKQGMSIKKVNTNTSLSESDLWPTSDTDKVKVLYHNNITYKDQMLYNFTLNFTDEGHFNIVIKQGNTVLDSITINDSTYTSGKFGFYNYSQEIVTYSVFTFEELPPMLEVNSVDKAKLGDEITANIVIHNATNICAEDLKIAYDTSKLQFISAENADGMKIYKEDDIAAGIKRYITACLGKANAANGDKIILKLKFKAIDKGEAKIDITNGRIADNATLEMDVDQMNCGEKTVLLEGTKDVNRTGEYTLLDLGIDAWYYGDSAADTDTSKYDADQVVNGTIDDADLTEVVAQILGNINYTANK